MAHHSSLVLAVASALVAAVGAQDAGRIDAQVRRALERARPALEQSLQQPSLLGGGPLGLLCLAALHDGMEADRDPLRPAIELLAGMDLQATYDLALRLLVTEACPSFPRRAEAAKADCQLLLRNRCGGAFGYQPNPGDWDLSNTQYAALGLRAATACGATVPRRVWLRLADDVLDAQVGKGGFRYSTDGGDATVSMTAAGIAVLAICAQNAGTEGRTSPVLDQRLAGAWRWLDRHSEQIGRPDVHWSYYFHYGLERAAILCDRTEVGEVDWYRQGARMFVTGQLGDGSWRAPMSGGPGHLPGLDGSPVDTAFAVLFLRRKFQKVIGPTTPARTVVLDALDAQASRADIDSCVDGLVRRGKTAMVDVLTALRSTVLPRRQAAAAALRQIAGDDFGVDPALPPEQNAAALRRAELWHLRNR